MATPPSATSIVFLSYAHNDNRPPVPGQQGWVDVFQYSLKVRLGQLLGSEPDVWWDHAKLHGSDDLAETITEALKSAAVLVTIVTPSYVQWLTPDDWCRREFETFCAAAEKAGGVRIGTRSRIFKVVKTYVPLDSQPAPLKAVVGYEFFRKDPVTGRLREISLVGAMIDQEYIQKVDDLAEDIKLFVSEAASAARLKHLCPIVPAGPVIYLAETTPDLTAERSQLMRTLRQAGYVVLPDRPLSQRPDEARTDVESCLPRAELSVHLIGPTYGDTIGESTSVVAMQHELAATRRPRLPRLIWFPPQLKPADERQEQFVRKLRTDPDMQVGAEVIAGTLEDLATEITHALGAKQTGDTTPPVTMAPGLTYVYLICEQRDLGAARALRDVLYASDLPVEVKLPVFEGDEADIRSLHDEYLRTCDGVLLFVGAATEPWLATKLLDLHKARGNGRDRPFAIKGIYFTGEDKPWKAAFRTREALILRNAGAPSLEALTPFLRSLKVAS